MTNMFKAFMAFQMFKKKNEEEKEKRETQLDNERVAMQNHLEVTLASKIRRLQNLYNRISVESGYREQVMDNTYMVNDLWNYSIGEFILCGDFPDHMQEDLLEGLVHKFSIHHAVSGKEHISNLKKNPEYKRYIHDCFEGTRGVPGFFWILLASMSGNEGERTKDTIQFTKDYCDFIREFSAYLLYQFPDLDVLSVEKKLINDMLEQSNIFLGKDDPYEDYQMPQFVNPLL